MRKRSKKQIIIIAGIAMILLGVIGSFSPNKTGTDDAEKIPPSENKISDGEIERQMMREKSSNEEVNKKSMQEKFADDEIVNDFIISYNKLSSSPLVNIEKGNIRTKYNALSAGYFFELLNAADTNAIRVTINQTNETAEYGVKGMKEVFHNVVKTIDPSLSDQEVGVFFDNMVSGYQIEDQELGKAKISFSPDVELSYGYSRGYIVVRSE